jgi:hypothetical protein
MDTPFMNRLSHHVLLASGDGTFDMRFIILVLGTMVLPLLPGLIMCTVALTCRKSDKLFWSGVVVLVLGIGVSLWFDPYGLSTRLPL